MRLYTIYILLVLFAALQVLNEPMQYHGQEQYFHTHQWPSDGSAQYYNNAYVSSPPGTSSHQSQVIQEYLPLPDNIKTEKLNSGVIYETNSVQSPQTYHNVTNGIAEDGPFGNTAYKQWKSKFSSQDSNGFYCLSCQGKSFTADTSLKLHYKKAHAQICNTCKMEFPEDRLLSVHIKENHEFPCSICSKVFPESSSLQRHYDQQHKNFLSSQQQYANPPDFPNYTSNINDVS